MHVHEATSTVSSCVEKMRILKPCNLLQTQATRGEGWVGLGGKGEGCQRGSRGRIFNANKNYIYKKKATKLSEMNLVEIYGFQFTN